MSEKRWTLEQKIGLVGVIVATVTCTVGSVIGLATPEIRLLLGLESSVEPTNTPLPTIIPSGMTAEGSPIAGHPVLEYFPLYVGTSWTYFHSTEAEGHGEDGRSIMGETSVITETVAMVNTSISDRVYIAKILVHGRSILARCFGTSTLGSNAEYWIVADESRVFIVCSKTEATSLATELAHGLDGEYGTSTPPRLPVFVLPLETGKVWQAFPDLPVEIGGSAYLWHVESKLDLRVPAGAFSDCYRIQLLTGPDATKRWVCPGVGLAAIEYNHHGAVHDYRAELVSYEVTGGE